jgi:hypothetical protein
VAGGVLLWLLVGSRFKLPWGQARRVEGGRWVLDRSLGGKMVFIPDASPAAAPHKAPRPLWDDDSAPDTPASAAGAGPGAGLAAAAAADVDRWATAAAAPRPAPPPGPPSWWDPPTFTPCPGATRREELQRQARATLRQLEDAKLLAGADYPVAGLVALRTLCQEAGGYAVQPRTQQGRDAMLRAGVQAALAAAQDGAYSRLGGDAPARWVGRALSTGLGTRVPPLLLHLPAQAPAAPRC